MRRRVASQGSIIERERTLSSHNLRPKSEDLSLTELFESSNIFLDERNNAKGFRQFYIHLKFAYTELQESYTDLEKRFDDALRGWLNEKLLMNNKIARISEEKQELDYLCAELQKSTLTPERLELIKCDVRNEMQKVFEPMLHKATKETEIARNECNKLMEELEGLKIDHEKLRLNSNCVHEREVLLHESECQRLSESHREIMNRLTKLLGSDAENLASLFRDNSQIRAQCHIVLDESEKSKRLYDTQMSELKNELISTIDALTKTKSDKAILAEKCETLKEEAEMLAYNLTCVQTELRAARQKIIDAERSKLSMEKFLEEKVQNLRKELNEMRLTTQKEHINVERQRDELAYRLQDMTNQMTLVMGKFEEAEAEYQQREQEAVQRELNLQESAKKTAEISKNRSTEMLHQLERTQSNLKELSSQHDSLAQALTEYSDDEIDSETKKIISTHKLTSGQVTKSPVLPPVLFMSQSENAKMEIMQKLGLMEKRNSDLIGELALVKQELTARKGQIECLENTMREMMSIDERIPEKDMNIEDNYDNQMASVREAYLKLLDKSKSQVANLSEKIRQLNTDLVAKICEVGQLRQENEKLKSCVPQSEYLKVKYQLMEFQRRKESYWLLLQQASNVLRETIPSSTTSF
ncbi:hypothetical protein Aperf_G00000038317 [Anoplocephala perfoliata]